MAANRLNSPLGRLLLAAFFTVTGLLASEHHGIIQTGGLPVPGATITATTGDKKVVTTSDEKGFYSFPELADGTWTITVESLGFVKATKEVGVVADAPSPMWDLKYQTLEAMIAPPTAEPAAVTPAAPAAGAPPAEKTAEPKAAETPATTAPATAAATPAGKNNSKTPPKKGGKNTPATPAPAAGARWPPIPECGHCRSRRRTRWTGWRLHSSRCKCRRRRWWRRAAPGTAPR